MSETNGTRTKAMVATVILGACGLFGGAYTFWARNLSEEATFHERVEGHLIQSEYIPAKLYEVDLRSIRTQDGVGSLKEDVSRLIAAQEKTNAATDRTNRKLDDLTTLLIRRKLVAD